MDNLVSRVRSKVVAFIDLVILSLIFLGGIILAAIITVEATSSIDEFRKHGISDEVAEKVKSILFKTVWTQWAIVTVQAVLTVLQVWAAMKLLRAAKHNETSSPVVTHAIQEK